MKSTNYSSNIDHTNLRGFAKEIVTVLGFWIGAPSRSDDGQMSLRVSGATEHHPGTVQHMGESLRSAYSVGVS